MSNSSQMISCEGVTHSSSASTVAIALSYVVLIPLIVLGNGLVVASFIINQKLRTATNIFICGLGLSDLLIGVFSVPYWTYISSLSSLMMAFCTPLYNVYICVDIGTGCASILQLTSIAIERLYFTVAPLKHRRLPRSVYWYMLGIAWIFSIFAASLQPLQNKAKWHDEYSVFLMVTCFLIPLVIIIIVYLYILKIGRDQAKRRASTQSRMGSTGAGYIKEFNIFITVIVITGVFAVAWAPFFITTVVANFCHTCLARPQSDHLVRFVKWMQYSSSAINPYIYAYRNEDVRSSFKKILRLACCFCCKDDDIFKSGTLPRRPTYDKNNAYTSSRDDVFDQSNDIGNHFPRVLDVNGVSCKEKSPRKVPDAQFEARNLKTDVQSRGQEQCYGKSNNGFKYPQQEPQLTKPKHFKENREIAQKENEHLRKMHDGKDANHISRTKHRSNLTFDQSHLENKRPDERHFQRKLYKKEQQVLYGQKRIMNDQRQEKRARSQSRIDGQSINENERDSLHDSGHAQNTKKQKQRYFDNKEIKHEEEPKRRRHSYSNREQRETRPSRRNAEKTYSFKHSIPCYENPVDVASEGTYV